MTSLSNRRNKVQSKFVGNRKQSYQNYPVSYKIDFHNDSKLKMALQNNSLNLNSGAQESLSFDRSQQKIVSIPHLILSQPKIKKS